MTDLPEVLETFDEKLFFTRIPLLVLVLQIAGIVLYYLFMVSTMLVERQAGEIALLKSRGATTAQVMQIYVIEGLVDPAASRWRWGRRWPRWSSACWARRRRSPTSRAAPTSASISRRRPTSGRPAARCSPIVTLLCAGLPARRARTVVQQRTASARPPKQAAFTRYYLDLVLVGIGGILFYQLNRRGSLRHRPAASATSPSTP